MIYPFYFYTYPFIIIKQGKYAIYSNIRQTDIHAINIKQMHIWQRHIIRKSIY